MTTHELLDNCIKRLESIHWVGSTKQDNLNIGFVQGVLESVKFRIKNEEI